MTCKSYSNPLFKLQKKIPWCIKFEPFTSSSTPIFQSLKFLKIEVNRLSPSCFHDHFQPNSSVHRIGTRQATRGDIFKSLKNTMLYGKQFNIIVQNFRWLSLCSYELLALLFIFADWLKLTLICLILFDLSGSLFAILLFQKIKSSFSLKLLFFIWGRGLSLNWLMYLESSSLISLP